MDKLKILLSSDDNIYYTSTYPIVASAWETLGCEPIYFVGNPKHKHNYGKVIECFSNTIPSHIAAMKYKWYYSGTFGDNYVVFSEMNMIPLNIKYYESLCTDKIVKSDLYIVGKSSQFKEYFNPNGLNLEEWLVKEINISGLSVEIVECKDRLNDRIDYELLADGRYMDSKLPSPLGEHNIYKVLPLLQYLKLDIKTIWDGIEHGRMGNSSTCISSVCG